MKLPNGVSLVICDINTIGQEVCKYAFKNRKGILLSVVTEDDRPDNKAYMLVIYKDGEVVDGNIHKMFPSNDDYFEMAGPVAFNRIIELLSRDTIIGGL